MWNQTIPDELRGRMAGTELLSYSLGPQLGQVRSSLVAQWTSLRVSIVSGGIACVAGAFVLAAALPTLWTYDERTDENAARERSRRTAAAALRDAHSDSTDHVGDVDARDTTGI